MFRFASRRQREYLATANESTRRSKVSSYLKKINPTDLSARPLHQYNEPTDPSRWAPSGLRRSDNIHLRLIPSPDTSGRSSCDSATSPPTKSRTSSSPSSIRKGKAREIEEDMIEMTIHNQHRNKIVILFDAVFWNASLARSYHHQVPAADIDLALELFQEYDKTQSSHWWTLAQAASKETSMRYSFTETGIRIDYIRNTKNVRFSSEESPVHIYEPIWIDDGEEDVPKWEHQYEPACYDDSDDTDDPDVPSKTPIKVDEMAALPIRATLKLLPPFFTPGSKIKVIPPSPSESSLSSGSLDQAL